MLMAITCFLVIPPHCQSGIIEIMRANVKHDQERARALIMQSIQAPGGRSGAPLFPLDGTLRYPSNPNPLQQGYIRSDVRQKVDNPFLNMVDLVDVSGIIFCRTNHTKTMLGNPLHKIHSSGAHSSNGRYCLNIPRKGNRR
jgi:hypothetical protein